MLGRILGAGASFPAYAFLEAFDLGDALRPLMTGTIDALMATVTLLASRFCRRLRSVTMFLCDCISRAAPCAQCPLCSALPGQG